MPGCTTRLKKQSWWQKIESDGTIKIKDNPFGDNPFGEDKQSVKIGRILRSLDNLALPDS